MIISILLQILVTSSEISVLIGTVTVQFMASLISGYVITQFYHKYSKISFMKVWGYCYAIIIALNLIANLLNLMP